MLLRDCNRTENHKYRNPFYFKGFDIESAHAGCSEVWIKEQLPIVDQHLTVCPPAPVLWEPQLCYARWMRGLEICGKKSRQC